MDTRLDQLQDYMHHSLRNLSSICKLQFWNLENVGGHEEVIAAKLKEKSYLRSLSLNWSETNNVMKNDDDLVLDKIEPHSHIENLEIAGYNGVRFPTWISHLCLINMVSLELRDCKNWAYLPTLGNLQLLKHLELQNLVALKLIGHSPDNSLPPNLNTIVVEGCINLEQLPLLPLSLTQLEVNHVGLTTLPRIYDHYNNSMGFEDTGPKLISVIISNCSRLNSLEGSFLLQEHYIQNLRVLSIVDCKRVESLPSSSVFKSLKALREMFVTDCINLASLGGLGALSYLTWLEIRECPVLEWSTGNGVDGDSVSEFSLLVYSLWIETPNMLKLEQLSRLCNTKGLIITMGNFDIPQQWLRQNSLETLEILKPVSAMSLEDLCALKRLEFDVFTLEFPILPSSLESFIIRRCTPELEECWKRKGSPEWDRISSIRYVRIGDSYYNFGEPTDQFYSCNSTKQKRKDLNKTHVLQFWGNSRSIL